MKKLGNTAKKGFETIATQSGYHAFTMTEAVASNGTTLRNLTVFKTFVPGPGLVNVCTEIQHVQLSDNTAGSDGDLSDPDLR
ncbi:hypothetical protein MMC30_006873 [Trapelia coarctata]|nr:hypothetical protein [Trapelia coarctata]